MRGDVVPLRIRQGKSDVGLRGPSGPSRPTTVHVCAQKGAIVELRNANSEAPVEASDSSRRRCRVIAAFDELRELRNAQGESALFLA